MARRNSSRCEKTTSSTLRKGAWTAEEDHKLIAYINRYGIWNWNHMPKPAGLERSGKSCRLRWMNYLRPNIKHGNFSSEEEETILKLHETLGNRWSTIAAKLPGRTDNEIKNYWHTYLKKRFKVVEAKPISNNDNGIDEAHKKKKISETEEGAPKGSSSIWEDENYCRNNLTILSPPHVQAVYTEDNFPSTLMDEFGTGTCSNQMDEESNISASTFGQLQSLWSSSSTLSSSLAKRSDSGLCMELENNSDHHHQFAYDDQLWQHDPLSLPCDLYGGDACINDWLSESIYTNWDAII